MHFLTHLLTSTEKTKSKPGEQSHNNHRKHLTYSPGSRTGQWTTEPVIQYADIIPFPVNWPGMSHFSATNYQHLSLIPTYAAR